MIRLALIALVSLSTSGCVAAIPLAMQLASGSNSASLCSMAKIPGQATSLCDHFSAAQPQDKAAATTGKVATAAK
jgi:hypothetical protein